ncbi:MAG: hypothetical protein R3Y50_06060 [Rikenellaceae bacterium]
MGIAMFGRQLKGIAYRGREPSLVVFQGVILFDIEQFSFTPDNIYFDYSAYQQEQLITIKSDTDWYLEEIF